MKTIKLENGKEQELLTESELQPDKMYIQIRDVAYIYASSSRELFKEMSGYYLEVETEHLFHDQYNTSQFRIFDSMVERVVNDVRSKWCKSKYTGKMVLVGDEHRYIDDLKKKSLTACDGCFWNRKETINKSVVEDENKRVTTEEFGFKCTFSSYTGAKCTYEEEIKLGFEYFTPYNTYFLRYPNRMDKPKKVTPELKNGIKIGTYMLEYRADLYHFVIRNSRKTIKFEYDTSTKKFNIKSGQYPDGLRGNLDVPQDVNDKVKEILNKAYNG